GVQAVHDRVAAQVVQQRGLERGVVVAVVERPGSGEEVEVVAAGGVVDAAAARLVEEGRPSPAVAADFGLKVGEGFHHGSPFSPGFQGTLAAVGTARAGPGPSAQGADADEVLAFVLLGSHSREMSAV